MTVGASTISATSQSRSGTLRLTVGLSDQDKSHLIEPLFLGSGPWALQGNTGCRADGVLRSLSTDVQYTLTASTDLSPSQQELFFTPFRQWNSVKNNAGRFTETVQSLDAGTPFRDGLPVGFIYAMFLDDTFGAKCGAAGSGCADAMSSAGNVNVITRGGITLRRTIGGSVFVHESGHMLGLCHVDHRIALAQDVSVMGGSSNSNVTTLTAEEVEALSRVHAARLQPGARRSDFVRAGLIIENGASIASPGGRLTTSPGGQFRILTDRIPLHR
jgi:hypothetical protein